MKIALSCNGEGFGHASRLMNFIALLEKDHELVIFSPDSTREFFLSKKVKHPIVSIPHQRLFKDKDRILYWKTFWENVKDFFTLPKVLQRIKGIFQHLQIDAVISDFEPYLPRAAKQMGIPTLQINHPGIVLKSRSIWPDALLTKQVARLMMGPYDELIYCSFYRGDIGPLIRQEIKSAPRQDSGRLTVYLKPGYKESVVRILDELGLVYDVFPDPNKNYAQHLASCTAVITSAGHQSICEAIYLGKPIFVIPQRGQYEQRLNAQMLRKSGRGEYSTLRALKKRLPRFLERLEDFPLISRLHDLLLEESTEELAFRLNLFLERTRQRAYPSQQKAPAELRPSPSSPKVRDLDQQAPKTPLLKTPEAGAGAGITRDPLN
jgi:UDP-N-acetylglucosamine:LPS N-acetylglucosamine transferase